MQPAGIILMICGLLINFPNGTKTVPEDSTLCAKALPAASFAENKDHMQDSRYTYKYNEKGNKNEEIRYRLNGRIDGRDNIIYHMIYR